MNERITEWINERMREHVIEQTNDQMNEQYNLYPAHEILGSSPVVYAPVVTIWEKALKISNNQWY